MKINSILGQITSGAGKAGKAVVLDANADFGGARNFRSTRFIRKATPVSDNTVGPRTYTATEFLGGLIVRDPNGAARTDVLPSAASLVAAVPGLTVGDCLACKIVNGADAAESITLSAGTGGSFDANQTAAARVIAQNSEKEVLLRFTSVTAGSEAYVVYA